jgi:hypothetical protein
MTRQNNERQAFQKSKHPPIGGGKIAFCNMLFEYTKSFVIGLYDVNILCDPKIKNEEKCTLSIMKNI